MVITMQKENSIENLSIEQIEQLINITKKDIIKLKKNIYNKSKFLLETVNNN